MLRAREYFGSWQKALETAGLDHSEIKGNARTYGRREDVIKALKSRKKKGQSLSTAVVFKEEVCLYWAAREFFGPWKAALKAAGLKHDRATIQPRGYCRGFPKYPDKESVIREIKRRHRKGLSLSSYVVQRTDDYTLDETARRLFGSWRAAVQAAGIDYKPKTWKNR